MREFGRQLKIHEELIGRHPFPGPGLGIRIIGEVTRERVEIVRKADHIFMSMIREAGIYDEVRRDHLSSERKFAKEIFQVTQAYAALDTNRGTPFLPFYEFVAMSDFCHSRWCTGRCQGLWLHLHSASRNQLGYDECRAIRIQVESHQGH